MISGNNFYDPRKHYKQKIKIYECKKRIKKHHAFQQVYATEKDDIFFNFIWKYPQYDHSHQYKVQNLYRSIFAYTFELYNDSFSISSGQ